MFGIAAGALLVIGLLRVFFFEKGAEYYFHSHAFLGKLTLFVVVGGARRVGVGFPFVIPGRA